MSPQGSSPDVPDILSELFAVVLPSSHGGTTRVRWNAAQHSWWHSNPYGPGFVEQKPPHQTGSGDFTMMTWIDTPTDSDLTEAASLAENFKESGYCLHCGRSQLGLHVISSDVFGALFIHCLIRPDPSTVDSFGGNGQTKHWGSPFGCRSVRSSSIQRNDGSYARVGYYLYGEPLTTIEALDRRWCSRCQGTARNVWNHESSELARRLNRDPTTGEVHTAIHQYERRRIKGDQIRFLLDEIGDRNRQQLITDMREAWHGRDEED